MICPECKKSDTKVLDSRDDERIIRRRRECLRCRYRFTTYERIESPRIKVIKRTGEVQDYQREKLARGINLACEKRPVTCTQVESIINDIEHEITKLKTKYITSKQIGKVAIEKLKAADEVAYLRFLSVYKSFGSASKFQKEAEKLTRDRNQELGIRNQSCIIHDSLFIIQRSQMSKILHPKTLEEFNKIISGDKPVLVDFYADWCGPCQMMAPMIDEMAEKYKNADKVEIVKVNTEEGREIAQEYGIMSIPTFKIFSEENEIEEYVGARPVSEFEAKLDELLK